MKNTKKYYLIAALILSKGAFGSDFIYSTPQRENQVMMGQTPHSPALIIRLATPGSPGGVSFDFDSEVDFGRRTPTSAERRISSIRTILPGARSIFDNNGNLLPEYQNQMNEDLTDEGSTDEENQPMDISDDNPLLASEDDENSINSSDNENPGSLTDRINFSFGGKK